MIIALIVVSMVMAYLLVGGVVGAVTLTRLEKIASEYDDPEFKALWAGALWPLALPLCLGIWIGRTPERAARRAAVQAAETQRRTLELEKELGMLSSATESTKPRPVPRFRDPGEYEYYLHHRLDPWEGRR